MKPAALVLLAACGTPPAPPPRPAVRNVAKPDPPPVADTCRPGGWPTAVIAESQYESGFDPTIAWNPVTKQPVLFDVAQQDDGTPTHWLRIHERSQDRWLPGVTLEAGVSGDMAAVVDDTGLIHLAFNRFDGGGGPFLGTIGRGTAWKVEGPIDPGLGFVDDRMSMLLEPGGDVVIDYRENSSRTIKAALRRAGTWKIETVAVDATLWRDHTLVRDSHGGLHIVAGDWSSGDIRIYNRAANGTWPFVVIEKQHASGASLAIDSQDRLHVSWVDWKDNRLNYASGLPAGPFEITHVATGALGNDTSIGVAANGTVSISYDIRECADVHLATLQPGHAWTTEVADTAGQVGADTGLVDDERGCVHLVYTDDDAWDLRYASKCPDAL